MSRRNSFEDVFKYVDIRGSDECWLWRGNISRKGLPEFSVGGKKYSAYRITKWLADGNFNINDESTLPRHCCKNKEGKPIDNPLCCNPAHTVMGSWEENMMDMMLRGRSGLTKDAIRDIIKLHDEFPDLTHGQIADRVEFKHQIKVARQTVTDILSGRRRAVIQRVIREEDGKKGHNNANGE